MATWPTTPPSGVESTWDITASTDVRDVSDVLDAIYLKDTPFINKIGWGRDVHNKNIEWISDNIGYGYVVLSHGGTFASDATSIEFGTSGLGAISLAMRQIRSGTILKYNGQSTKADGYMVVYNWSVTGVCSVTWLTGATVAAGISDATTFYIVGSPVAEGSTPRRDQTRPRTILTNRTQIERQDVRITGTRQQTMMHAVGNELNHQIMLRAAEYKRQLERTAILGQYSAGSSTLTPMMGGLHYWLNSQSGSHIDSTTTTLTESAINAIAAYIWDKGGTPDTLLMGSTQARNIPTFERARVRLTQDTRIAGFYINQFLTDLGVYMDILISRWVPSSYAFILDASKIKMHAFRGRKYLLSKLGLAGDYTEYQLISEFTMSVEGYDKGCHGMLTNLA